MGRHSLGSPAGMYPPRRTARLMIVLAVCGVVCGSGRGARPAPLGVCPARRTTSHLQSVGGLQQGRAGQQRCSRCMGCCWRPHGARRELRGVGGGAVAVLRALQTRVGFVACGRSARRALSARCCTANDAIYACCTLHATVRGVTDAWWPSDADHVVARQVMRCARSCVPRESRARAAVRGRAARQGA